MSLLSSLEIEQGLKTLPGWRLQDGEIVRTFQFPDFVLALRFVNRVGETAEKQAHHPDIDIRYNKVKLALTSHDSGGLTQRDFALAAASDGLYSVINK